MNDNITHPLQDSNSVEETPDAPLSPEQLPTPGAQQGDMSNMAPTILVIVEKMAPKFPNIDPNIIAAVIEELQGMKPCPNMASGIRDGHYSMQDIVAHLGYDYKEFKADMHKVYGNFEGLRSFEAAELAVQNLFRNKYGLAIRLKDFMTSDCDDETYWRTKLANAVEKLEQNVMEVGDEVIILSGDQHFGKIGTLMALDSDKAEVLEDGIANQPLMIADPLIQLRLLSGQEKRATLRLDTTDATAFHNEYYPDGIGQAAVSQWYRNISPVAYRKLAHVEPITLHKVAGINLSCQHKDSCGDIAEVNQDNLTAIHAHIADITKVAALKITPTAGRTDVEARAVVSDLVDELVVTAGVEDIQVRFSGSRGYYVLVTFAQADHVDQQQQRLRGVVATYLYDNPTRHGHLGATTEPGKISISSQVRTVPAAYSVDVTTGLVSVPLDLQKLEHFDLRQATITHLSAVYGFDVAAQ